MKKANKSVECSVKQCANHCNEDAYCGLNTVKIGTHELNPTMNECTDCQSFVLKK